MARRAWGYNSSGKGDCWDDEEMEVTVTADHVLITVTAEHAVDSYNETFRNSIKLPFPQVRELVKLLQQAISESA